MKILHVNVNHCRDAQHLLRATAAELRIDVVAVADPLWNPGGWAYGGTHGAAVRVTGFNGRRALDDMTTCEPSHVAVVVEGIKIVSCYFRPNVAIRDFHMELDALDRIRREWRGPILYCGDFNAKSPAWGSRSTDQREAILLEFLAGQDLYPVRARGRPYTFLNGRGRTAVLDFAFCDAETLRRIGKSKTLAEETRSDHMYVVHELVTPEPVRIPPPFKWNPRSLEVEKMKEAYEARVNTLPHDGMWDELQVQEYLDIVEQTCAEAMTAMIPPCRATTVGLAGWTPELREMRREARRLRCRKQRAHRRAPEILEERKKAYSAAWGKLRRAMYQARTEAWKDRSVPESRH